MKKFLYLFLILPLLAFGAAGDMQISVKNSNDKTWVPTIFPSKVNSVLGEDGTGLPSLLTSLTGVTVNGAPGGFTTLSASGAVSGAGFTAYLASPPAIGGTVPAAGTFTSLLMSGGGTISGIPAPSAGSEAVNKTYADSIAGGIFPRTSVTVATTATLTLSGEQTIDGILTSSTRILVKNQSTTSQNGIYVTGAGAWTRAIDSDTAGELLKNYYYFVASGSTQAGSGWFILTAPTVLGVDPVVFSQFSSSQTYTAGTGLSLVGLQFNVNGTQTLTGGSINGMTVGNSSPSTGAFTTLAASSTVSGAGFSTYLASPPAIGGTVPAAGAFTNISSSGTVSGTGFSTYLASPPAIGGTVAAAGSFTTLNASGNTNIANGYLAVGTQSAGSSTSNIFLQSGSGIGSLAALNFSLNTDSIGSISAGYGTNALTYNSVVANGHNFTVVGASKAQITATGINNAAIGATSPSTGAFTTLAATGTLTLSAASGLINFSGATLGRIFSTGDLYLNPAAAKTLYLGDGNTVAINSTGLVVTGTLGLINFSGATLGQIISTGDLYLNPAAAKTLYLGDGNKVAINSTGLLVTGNISATNGIQQKNIINVRNYGAVGDGSTNDTTAINSAIAALTSYSTLYLPSGKYLVTPGSLTTVASINHITICGDGWSSSIYSSTTGTAGNLMEVAASCSYVTVRDLAFVGSATGRGSGIHLRMLASHADINHCYFYKSSDFGLLVSGANDGSAYSTDVKVTGCTFDTTLGDGIHYGATTDGLIANNIFLATGDDSIGLVSDDGGTHVPTRINVTGNYIYNSGSRGVAMIDGPTDILVSSNQIRTTVGAAIEVNRSASTTVYANRVMVSGNKVYNSTTTLGPTGAILMAFTNQCLVTANQIDDTANGSDISFLDFNGLTISGNECRGSPSRSIASDDGTTANVAATWAGLMICNNTIRYNISNQAIYAVPHTGIQINNVLITGNTGNELPAGDWIYCARVATGKICNNTARDGNGVTAGGLTAVNNN